ncbi:MAG: hypothetical protein KGL39_30815 [Patescibacteria group bacterium]|nr:hypothetical protein [Patescibacteria group bacterium]
MSRCTVTGEEPTNPSEAPVPNGATRPDGQHVDHWTMCPTEIMEEGFKRPVRTSYVHVGPPPPIGLRDLTDEQRVRYAEYGYVKFEPNPDYPKTSAVLGTFWTQDRLDRLGKGCGVKTSMPRLIAETYAAKPDYYGSTFCCGCGKYLPVGARGEFVWDGTEERVGT